MTASRDRKQAAKILGITLQAQFRAMQEATDQNGIEFAAIRLGDTFNRNIEFICWVLKEYGGVEQMPMARPEPIKRPNLKLVELPSEVPQLPEFLTDTKTVI